MEIDTSKPKKNKNRGGRFFFFIFSILCVAICVFVAQFFASVISTGSYNFFVTSGSSNSEYKLYALSLASFSTNNSAQEFASEVQKQNAGGYIYNKDSKYYVLASIYEKENDAESVKKNIIDKNPEAEIIEIEITSPNFSKLNSANLKKEYLSIFSSLKEVYCKLYDISVSLDTSVYSETKSKIEIDGVKTSLETSLNNLSNGTTSIEGIYYMIIKEYLQNITNKLSETIEYSSTENFPFGAKLKYVYIDLVLNILDLTDKLNEA